MIVTAQPKAHSPNVESDEEVDEMKSLAETSLLDSLNMTTGSPTLSRSLSAREKRRNEVTVSILVGYFENCDPCLCFRFISNVKDDLTHLFSLYCLV